ncbi:T9SS type A sorting domain-containing protein [Flavobacterium sangjuense]|nr:T9SS type A sorting domain-containing protein [Flavobacterium sangjuense]
MKKSTLLQFFGFPCCDSYVTNEGESGLKFDFSKSSTTDSDCPDDRGSIKNKGMISIAMLFVLFLFSNFLTAQTITVDGNPADWSGNASALHVQDAFGNGQVDNQFTTGSKDFFFAVDLQWSISQTKAKNDIANGAFQLANQVKYIDTDLEEVTLNGTFLVFAGDRTSNNGDAQIGFWFYLNGTHPVDEGGLKNFKPPHVRGDLLVLANFTGGGRLGTVSVYRWVGGEPVTPGSSYVPNTNNNLETTNVASVVAENNATSYPVPAGWGFLPRTPLNYQTNEFYEGFVDLSTIGGNTNFTCSATVLLETRSSQSVTASLDDFVGGTLGNVPVVTVNSPSITCAGGSAQVTATVDPVGTYTYVWTVPPGATDPGNVSTFSTSVPGTYSVIVTNETGCESNPGSGVVSTPTAVELTAQGTNPPCFGGTGSITFSATGGTGAITYTVNGNAATSPATGLAAGVYTIVATDANGCTDSEQVTITVPTAVNLTAQGTNPPCFGGAGSITFSATGGTGAKTYTVNGNAATSPATGLAAGVYTIVATDVNGCTDTEQVTITVPTAVNLTAQGTDPLCFGGTGSITFSATGGTGAKTYTVNGNAATSPATGLAAGVYTIVATDVNGCTDTEQVTITVPTAVELTAQGTNPPCFGGTGSITFSATGGTGAKTYTVNGNAATSPATGLAAGVYTIVATDVNGCTDTEQVTITVPTAVNLTAQGTNPPCFGGTGSITFSATGGTGAKTYTVNGNAATSPATGLAAGVYTIVATDVNGCTDTEQVTITIPTAVNLTAQGTNPPCFGGTGSITFSATGGTGAKTYTVNGNAATSPATGLAAGVYTIVATDVNGCTDTEQVTITVPTAVNLTAQGTNPPCFGGTGSITFSATGGTGAKTYTVNGNAATSPATGLAAGVYTIVATDVNGCTDTEQVTITIPTAVNLTAQGTNPPCFGGTGSITFSATGGTGAKTYTVNGNAATSPATGLAAGVYTIVATDVNGCTDTEQVTITIPTAVNLTAQGTNPPCFGGTGSITFSATGGTGAKTYTVNGNAATSPATGLAAGVYTIVATDVNGCTDTEQVTITVPTAVNLTAQGTNPPCFGGTGSITFSATGGTGAKTYTVNGNAATSPATGLAAGVYTIVATDVNGCTDTEQVTITIPTAVNLTAQGTNPPCFGGTGSITFSATGGTGAKTYTVNGNAATSPATGLAAGVYTIVATDVNGCTDTEQVTITIPTGVNLTAQGTNPPCFGGTGSITFSATGGTGTITYTVNGNAATSPATGLAAGVYTIVATDASGCTDTEQVTITVPTAVNLTAQGTNPPCFGGTGSITFSATGGTGAKTYTVNGNAATSPATGLAAGVYTIVATDVNGCTDTEQVTITIPTAVNLTAQGTNPPCFGGTGSITFSATGGTGAKTYTVNGNAATSPATGLAAGVYTIVATDVNGCTDTEQVTITVPTAVNLTAQGTNPPCFGGTGSITFSATGGTGAKTYTVNGNAATSPATGLAAGVYTIVATDVNGCTDTEQVTITIPTAVNLTAQGTNPPCFGGTGSITFSATGGTGAKTYTVNGNAATSPATGLAAGVYTIVATDVNGCTDTEQVTITIPTAVNLTAQGTNPPCFGGTGSITFSATGGTGAKTYTVNGNAATSPATGLAAGVYTIVATDVNGCTDTEQVTITIPTAVNLTAQGTNPPCFGGTGSITFSATGGTGAKTYTVNGNAATSPATGLAAGVYTIVATDVNGCTDTEQVTITVPTAVNLTAQGTNPPCFGGTGSITFSATGGTGAKTYTVNGNAATSPATGLAAGVYTIVATDVNGCTDTEQVTITIPTAVNLTAQGTNPPCFGGTGSITFSATGGTGAKTYTVNGNAATSPATGLAAGVYTIVATDVNGCTDTEQVTITIPTAVNLTAQGTNPPCFGGTGSITFSATGGTGAKTYTVNGNAATSPATGLAAGVYTIVATDVNGCTDTEQVTITVPTAVNLTAQGTNPPCFGGTGSITFSATGGTGAKTYTVNGNAATSPATGLAAGVYTIVATDVNGCTDTEQVTITIPTAVNLTAQGTNPPCFGGTGSITFSATGGTGAKTYTVNGNAATSPATGLAAGVYTIVATDVNGCTDTEQVTITIPTAVNLTAQGTNPPCFGGTGSITFSATGGTGAKTYTVNGNAATSPATGLAAGVYTIVATDVNGCTDTEQVTITVPTEVVLIAQGTDPLCFGGTGSITFSATGGTGESTYTVNGNAATSPATGLAAGVYTIVATDVNGCTDSEQVTITVPTEVELSLTSQPEECENGGNGSIEATFSGGTGTYTVSIDAGPFTEQSSPYTFANLNSGSHTVTVRDANGCEDSAQITVELIPCDQFCTYTQGAYGSAGGAMCDGTTGGYTTAGMIAQILTNLGGTVTIGRPGRSVVMNSPSAVDCIIDRLPGGGGAKELKVGDVNICSLPASYLHSGRINNVLLSQTITLVLNGGIHSEDASDLSDFVLQAGTIATAEPEGGCGSTTATERVCGHYDEFGVWINTTNEYTYKTISAAVVNAITPNGNGDKTVDGLIDLANRALGNADGVIGTEGGVGLSAINAAVDALNNVFDECKIFVGWNVAPCPARPAPVAKNQPVMNGLSVIAYPNPFADNFKIDVKTSNDADLNVKVFDMLGRLLQTNNVKVTNAETLEIGGNYPAGVYNVIVTQGEEVKTQRVIKR